MLEALFYQRALISLWLGVVFFTLFSLLDFVYCRPYFQLFFFYRFLFVLVLLGILHLLKFAVQSLDATMAWRLQSVITSKLPLKNNDSG